MASFPLQLGFKKKKKKTVKTRMRWAIDGGIQPMLAWLEAEGNNMSKNQ